MLSNRDLVAIKRSFDADGFVLLPSFFDPAVMDRIDTAVREHFGDAPDFQHSAEFITRSRAEIVPWFPQSAEGGNALFDDIDRNPDFIAITQALIGEGFSRLYAMAMFSARGTSGQAWHQDCPPENATNYNLNRLIYSAAIVPDIGGEVVVLPGSHRQGVLPVGPPDEDMPGQVVLLPGKGDLLFIHGHCWHRVLPVHGGSRHSLNHRAAPAGVPAGITDICVYRNMRYRFSTSEIVEERVAT